jgi:hypothetical protein
MFDLSRFHGADASAMEVPVITLASKSHDIYAATRLGFLPFLKENHGADALALKYGYLVGVELKTSFARITADNAFKTKRGTIYITENVHQWGNEVDVNKTTKLPSRFVASFAITSDKQYASKNRDTYLIAIDAVRDIIIDCFMLEGDSVINFLESSNSIKLGSFMSYGDRVKMVDNSAMGYDNWVAKLSTELQCKQAVKF